MEMDKILKELTIRSFNDYYKLQEKNTFVIKGVVPILYFGNLEKYRASNIKILTVAINPSDNEFKEDKSDPIDIDLRFKGFDRLVNVTNLKYEDMKLYVEGLNSYFEYNPYKKWFFQRPRNALLNELNASYRDYKKENIVLHTDIVTPLATDPTWSKIKGDRTSVMKKGISLWKELVEYLQPDIMLMSLKEEYFGGSLFGEGEEYERYEHTKEGKKRKDILFVNKYIMKLKSGKIVKIYNESITNCVPFNNIGEENAIALGKKILQDS